MKTAIELKNVFLTYDLYYDKTQTLKEFFINFMHRRKYVEERMGKLNAIDNVSLKVQEGERLGIIGHNGAGKSTLLKVISGILKPSQGAISVNGHVQPLIEIAAGFNPEFSGRENIYLNGYMLGFTKEQIQEKEQEIIDFSELQDFIDIPVKYYSSGMSVRLAFTIATSIEPEYLIFDEMLAAGDASFVDKSKQRMNNLVDKARLVVLVSHSLEFIRTFCTRVLVMEKGKVIYDGTPGEAIDYYLDMVAEKKQEQPDQPLKIEEIDSRLSGDGKMLQTHFKISPLKQIKPELKVTFELWRGEDLFVKSCKDLKFDRANESYEVSLRTENTDHLVGDYKLTITTEGERSDNSRFSTNISKNLILSSERDFKLDTTWSVVPG